MELLVTEEVSTLTRLPAETIRYFRWNGKGPRWFKLGRRVVYDRRDVEAWIEAQRAEASA